MLQDYTANEDARLNQNNAAAEAAAEEDSKPSAAARSAVAAAARSKRARFNAGEDGDAKPDAKPSAASRRALRRSSSRGERSGSGEEEQGDAATFGAGGRRRNPRRSLRANELNYAEDGQRGNDGRPAGRRRSARLRRTEDLDLGLDAAAGPYDERRRGLEEIEAALERSRGEIQREREQLVAIGRMMRANAEDIDLEVAQREGAAAAAEIDIRVAGRGWPRDPRDGSPGFRRFAAEPDAERDRNRGAMQPMRRIDAARRMAERRRAATAGNEDAMPPAAEARLPQRGEAQPPREEPRGIDIREFFGGRRPRAAPDSNASVDVSDDDAEPGFEPGPVPVFRLKRSVLPSSNTAGGSGKRKTPDEEKKPAFNLDSDSDAEDYVEENLPDLSLYLYSGDSFAAPSSELWGTYPREKEEGDDSDDSDDDDDNEALCIPRSWLRSGFKLSECGHGLVAGSPTDEEFASSKRSNSSMFRDGPLKKARGIFPYNCKGVSAVLSLVTALLYSGASVQSDAVSCDGTRRPFEELTCQERHREFDSRLVDALAALIHVAAANNSRHVARKLDEFDRILRRKKRRGGMSAEEEVECEARRRELERRTRLCQVCWWPLDDNDTPMYPASQDPKEVKFLTSLTNIGDLKSYVKANLRSFKEPGGCALLLETVLHAHGQAALTDMFAGGSSDEGAKQSTVLLRYKCDSALKRLENLHSGAERTSTGEEEECDCATPQLMSLLLTGQVHGSYSGWNADMFGIGILRVDRTTSPQPAVDNRLLRPLRPVWLGHGETGHSVLMLDKPGLLGDVECINDAGRVFRLAHWSVWNGARTGMKVVVGMREDGPYDDNEERANGAMVISDGEGDEGWSVKDSIRENMRREMARDAALPWQESALSSDADPDSAPVTDEELASVEIDPDDRKFYPDEFRRWRFKFAADLGSDWTPFYKLRGRRRMIVEMRLAPSICALVRTRWPMATLRDFEPSGGQPLV